MINKKFIFSAFALLAMGLGASAQTTISFETEDFKSIGVYDQWSESPFRTGALKGNAGVTDNPDKNVDEVLGMAPNGTDKVLALQRSRHGGNAFGVRIDLNSTFELTPQTQYLHVMINRPYSGRIMVVGLGKRTEAQERISAFAGSVKLALSSIGQRNTASSRRQYEAG